MDGCVSGCLLTSLLLILVGGSFEKLAVDEGGSGADEWDEVGCVDAAPPGSGADSIGSNAIATPAARDPRPLVTRCRSHTVRERSTRLTGRGMWVYRGHVVSFWRPRIGQLRLRDLRRGHVEKALRALGQRQSTGRTAGNSGHYAEQRSAATIDSYRRTLRAALSAARRRELIHWNPADGRIDAIPDRVDEAEFTIWEPNQTARFLGTWPAIASLPCTSWPRTADYAEASCAACAGPTSTRTALGCPSARPSSR